MGNIEGVVKLPTTEESIDQTVRLISNSQSPVIRLVYFPVIHRNPDVQQALEQAIAEKTVEIICPTAFKSYIYDSTVEGYTILTEADKQLLSKARTIAVNPTRDGSSCTTDLPFTLETMAESFYIEDNRITINPEFLEAPPSGERFIWYTVHERAGKIHIPSVLYSAEYAAKQVAAYRQELQLWLELNIARPYLKI